MTKETKYGLIAIMPILLILWLVLGFVYGFLMASVCVTISTACTAAIYKWIEFVFNLSQSKPQHGKSPYNVT